MRISLVERQRKRRKGRQHRNRGRNRRTRRARARSFETSTTQLEVEPGRRSEPSRASTQENGAGPQPHSSSPVTASPSVARRQGQWQLVLVRLLVFLLLTGLIGALVYTSTAADFFVYSAQIRGSGYVEPETIYKAAGVHEQNIFWIQPGKAAERIVQLGGIKAASVRCDLPAQVIIEVEEREPVVMWRPGPQGSDLWLDEEGVVLPYGGVVSDTIFVVGPSQRELEPGERIEPNDIVQSVQQLAASLPEVRVYFYQPDRGLSFTQGPARAAWPVYVGNSEDLPRKIQVLQALTEYLAEEKIRPDYVDVRWADYPVYGKPGGKTNSRGE